MRIVDFVVFPDGSEGRDALLAAIEGVDLGDGELTEPIDAGVVAAVGLPASLDDDQARERADAIRDELDAAVGDAYSVRFQLADGPSDTAGGSPDHLE